MKSAILVVVIAAGIGGSVSSSAAQDLKKLQPHPAAAANPSLRQESVELPSGTASYYGGASAASTKPTTSEAVASGVRSIAPSKQSSSSAAQDLKRLQPHPAAAANPSLRQESVELPSGTAGYYGGASAASTKPTTSEAVTSGVRSIAPSKQSSSSAAQDLKKLQPHPAAAANPSLRQESVELPSGTASYYGGASAASTKPTTGDAVASGVRSIAPSKQNQ
jgi:hypothetical protein